MKKIVSLLLCAMLAAMVAGCSNSDKKQNHQAPPLLKHHQLKLKQTVKLQNLQKRNLQKLRFQRQEIIQKKKLKAKLLMTDFLLSSKMTTGELWSNSVVALVIAMLKALIT